MNSPSVGVFRWFYLDFNSYFASVEQQLRPELRSKPIAVIPVDAATTCCIAVSYEAKRFGVVSGMEVREARKKCPELRLVVGRQKEYVRMHAAFCRVISQCVPIAEVHSIDEVSGRLESCGEDEARRVALLIKERLRSELGEWMRCSIGIASNMYLAKLAAEMQKPDGLTVLDSGKAWNHLERLPLRALPGLGEQMEMRLARRGVRSVKDLMQLSACELRAAWGSLEGKRLWYWLRGFDFDAPQTTANKTIGHQHVLPPKLRTREGAGMVARKLMARAAERLCAQDAVAGGLSVYLSFDVSREKQVWECHARITKTHDLHELIAVFNRMWKECPAGRPVFVGVMLYDLMAKEEAPGWLFAADDAIQSEVMEKNDLGLPYEVPRQVAFRCIPDFDEIVTKR